MDCIVKSWLLGTISDNLAETISMCGASTGTALLDIKSQILGNRETQVLYLDAQFRNFSQGDLSILLQARETHG